MEKPQHDYNDLKTPYFSFGDMVTIGLMLATGLYFIITSALRIGFMDFATMEILDFFAGIIGLIVGVGLIYGSYIFVKRSAYFKAIVDGIFVEALYDRLEPLLVDIAETRASYDILNERIDNLNYNMNDIRKGMENGKSDQPADIFSLQYAIKNINYQFQYTMLTVITLAIYMFMFYNTSELVPYLSPVIYGLWWALITYQHDLWEVQKAWYWIAVPLLFIPIYTILVTALYTANIMLMVMYIGLGAYALSYYIWCEYTSRGILPFGIGDMIKKIRTTGKTPVAEVQKPEARKPVMKPYYIGSILTILAILAFAISIIGYLIENEMINFSWEMIGLDITWQPLYFYGLLSLGTLLLLVGAIFVVRFRKFR